MLQLTHKDIKSNKIMCGICGTSVVRSNFVRHLKSKKCRSAKERSLTEITDMYSTDDSGDNEPLDDVMAELQKQTMNPEEEGIVAKQVAKIEAKLEEAKQPEPVVNKIEEALKKEDLRKRRLEQMFKQIWDEEEEKRRLSKMLQN